jgi:hypothetical protein
MKILQMMGTSLITVTLLAACDSGNKNTSVDNAKSSQKAAEEYSKSFDNSPAHRVKTVNAAKKSAPAGAGIVGLPKDAVKGAKTVVEKISNAGEAAVKATKSAVGKLSDGGSDTGKGVVEGAKAAVDKTDNNVGKPAETATSSTSAQEATAELSKETPANDPQKVLPAKKPNADTKKPAPASAGIAGLPKEAVESAKTIVKETKEVAKKAVGKISGTGEAVDNASKPALDKVTDSKPGPQDAAK